MSFEDKLPFRYFLPTGCSLIKTIPVKNNSLVGLTLSILAINNTTSQCLWKKYHKCYKNVNHTLTEIAGTDNLEFGEIPNLEILNMIFPDKLNIVATNLGTSIILINGYVNVEILEWN